MQKSYTFNYLKIYFWQGSSIVLNLLSMFIVIPRLADNPSIYGIYVVCISANIFLSYADIGFAGAGYKFAAESFAQNNLAEEIKIIGFIGFILLSFLVIFASAVFFLALNPSMLIKNIHTPLEADIASQLLLILALFSPVCIFQRILDIIYGIRLEQYIIQQSMILASALKILSVLYFFKTNYYDIVGYYVFCNLANLTVVMVNLFAAKVKYHYNFLTLLKSFNFSLKIFHRTKALAFGSLFSTIMFILYYELDAFAIAKLLGVDCVAIYAIGFTIMSFLRNLFGVFYTPFLARFNHCIGMNDIDGLRNLYNNILALTLPFVIFIIFTLCLLMAPLIYSWVGPFYEKSIILAQLLILSYIYSFFSYPASFLIIAQERIKMLYLASAISPLVYWIGIAFTINYLGLMSFALFKFIAISISSLIYFFITLNFLNLSISGFIKKIIRPLIVPLGFLILALWFLNTLMPMTKHPLNLLIVVLSGGLIVSISLFLYSLCSNQFRDYTHELIRKVSA